MSSEVNKDSTSSSPISNKMVEWVFVNLNYIVSLILVIILTIANSHYAERKLRNIDKVKKEVTDYKAQYLNLKQSVESGLTESTLAKDLEQQQIKPNTARLKKITVAKKEEK
jgi:uncharacterized membrane-anchored protein YhcB (DUF1043 family)